MRIVLGTVVLIALLAIMAPAGAQPANWIVIPGHAVGDIQLGMTQQQVLNRLGMPDEISNDRAGDGSVNVYWTYQQTERSVLVVSWTKRHGEAGGADFIFTDNPRYVTSKGVSFANSTFKDILTHYGAPDRLAGGGRSSVVLAYEAQGIRFRLDSDGRVTGMTVVPRK
ncbi:MAG: hypothetical protein FJX73_01780 [Armatimonadetes bacterium]|nr:hypothetical protein [Armatimonadota bacterium]